MAFFKKKKCKNLINLLTNMRSVQPYFLTNFEDKDKHRANPFLTQAPTLELCAQHIKIK